MHTWVKNTPLFSETLQTFYFFEVLYISRLLKSVTLLPLIHTTINSSIMLLANIVTTKCGSSKLIAILSCKIIIGALEQVEQWFVNIFIINIEQIIV